MATLGVYSKHSRKHQAPRNLEWLTDGFMEALGACGGLAGISARMFLFFFIAKRKRTQKKS